MFTLAASDTIAGVASAATEVTYTLFGMELNGTTETYKALAQGQFAASAATIYTATANGPTFVRTITVVNTNATTARTFQLFRGGTANGNAITPVINLPAGGAATYEDGKGWDFAEIPVGTTLLNDIHTGYAEFEAIANPSTPASGKLRQFARLTSGRTLMKWIGAAGVDTWFQPALFGNNIIMWTPTSSTTVTGGFGTLWAKGSSAGTVSTIAPSSASPAVVSQMKRTRHANAVTTTNQVMGIISTASGMPQFWRGNSAGLGGFFFFTRFVVELWAADSCRLFVGLTPGTAEVAASDTFPNNTIGLWHDTTMGANVLYLATKDTTTLNLGTAISSVNLGAAQGFDFYMYAKPYDTTIYYRLDDINAGTTLIDSSVDTNLPADSTFLGPQVTISNGTANITVTTVAIGVNRIYVEADR